MKTVARTIAIAAIAMLFEATSQPVSPEALRADSLHVLSVSNRGAAMKSLILLTATPEQTMDNLPELLSIAEQNDKDLGVHPNFGMFGDGPFWHEFQSMGAAVLGRIADSTRYLTDDSEQERAINLLKPFVQRAILGNMSHITPPKHYWRTIMPYLIRMTS